MDRRNSYSRTSSSTRLSNLAQNNSNQIPDSILCILKCCLSDESSSSDEHIVKDPILLKCGANCCYKCIDELIRNRDKVKCNYCHQMHDVDELKRAQNNPNPSISVLINTFSYALNQLLYKEYEDNIDKITILNEESFSKKVQLIEESLDARCEFLKNQIDELCNEMKQNLVKLKSKYKNSITPHDIKSLKKDFETLKKKTKTNSSDFYETQEKLKKLRKFVKETEESHNQVQFELSDLTLDDSYIGKLVTKSPKLSTSDEDLMQTPSSQIIMPMMSNASNINEFNKLNKISTIKLKAKDLWRLACVDNKIYITDYEDKKIIVLSKSSSNIIGTYSPSGLNTGPLAICSNGREQIFVGDQDKCGIMKFDQNMNLVKKFGKNILKRANYMTLDNQNELYVSDWTNNEVSIWDIQTFKHINTFNIDSPSALRIIKNKIFIVSGTEHEFNEETRKLTYINKGSNCVYKVDKSSLSISQKIRSDTWLDPCGLQLLDVDLPQSNLLTVAYELDNDKIISQNLSLFIIDLNGNFLRKIKLRGITHLADFLFVDNKIYGCINDEVKIVDFI